MTIKLLDEQINALDANFKRFDHMSYPASAGLIDRVRQWRSIVDATVSDDAGRLSLLESLGPPMVQAVGQFVTNYAHQLPQLWRDLDFIKSVAEVDTLIFNHAKSEVDIASVIARERIDRDNLSFQQVIDAYPRLSKLLSDADEVASAAQQAAARLDAIGSAEIRMKAVVDAVSTALVGANKIRDELSELHGAMTVHQRNAETAALSAGQLLSKAENETQRFQEAAAAALDRLHSSCTSQLANFDETAQATLATLHQARDAFTSASRDALALVDSGREAEVVHFRKAASEVLNQIESDRQSLLQVVREERATVESQRIKDLEDFQHSTGAVMTGLEKHREEATKQIDAALQEATDRVGLKEGVFGALVEHAKTEFDKAIDQLNKAKADLNRQGLASAYTKRVANLRRLIMFYNCGFGASLAGFIGLFAWRIHTLAVSLTDPNIWLQLAIAAPVTGAFIWAGWICVSRVNVFNRVIEDYEFKAATATAFEAYKREVQDVDQALMGELIKRAINNFGLSPTRLMPAPKSQHAMPSQAALKGAGDFMSKMTEFAKSLRGP